MNDPLKGDDRNFFIVIVVGFVFEQKKSKMELGSSKVSAVV